jgi:hypothetical protein
MLTPAATATAAGLAAMILASPALYGRRLRTRSGHFLIQGSSSSGQVWPGRWATRAARGVMLLVAIGAGAWLIGAEGRRAEADLDGREAQLPTTPAIRRPVRSVEARQ